MGIIQLLFFSGFFGTKLFLTSYYIFKTMKKLKEFYYDDILYTCLLDYSIVLLLNFLYFMFVHTLQIYFCLFFCFVTASNLMMSGFILLSFFFSLMHLLSVLVKLISVLFLFVFCFIFASRSYICFLQ